MSTNYSSATICRKTIWTVNYIAIGTNSHPEKVTYTPVKINTSLRGVSYRKKIQFLVAVIFLPSLGLINFILCPLRGGSSLIWSQSAYEKDSSAFME